MTSSAKKPTATKVQNKVDAAQFAPDEEATNVAESQEAAVESQAPDPNAAAQRKAWHDLEQQVEKLQQSNKDLEVKMLYHVAECQNIRDRAARDVENAHRFGTEKLLKALLPVLDSMERGMVESNHDDPALRSFHEGMSLTHTMFIQVLEKFQVEQIDPMEQPFNPDLHEAVSMREESSAPSKMVLEVIQKGYSLNGRLIRPALVVVAK